VLFDSPGERRPGGRASGKMAIWGAATSGLQRYRRCSTRRRPGLVYRRSGSPRSPRWCNNLSGYMTRRRCQAFTMGVKAASIPPPCGRRCATASPVAVAPSMAWRYFLPNVYDPPRFALKARAQDVCWPPRSAAKSGVPMRLPTSTLEEMTEALARGWRAAIRDRRWILQQERAGPTSRSIPPTSPLCCARAHTKPLRLPRYEGDGAARGRRGHERQDCAGPLTPPAFGHLPSEAGEEARG